jgi:GDP-L-fucose synthase
VAKIAGIELCLSYNKQYDTDYICLVPTNMFGMGDNYDLERSHLVAALIRKIHEAKIEKKDSIKLWGTGRVLREVLCSDELADACLFFMNNYSGNDIINIGSGVDYSISDLANMIKSIVGYNGKIEFDTSKPDGMYKKQLDVTRASQLGWKAKNNLAENLNSTYNDFTANYIRYCNK